MKWFICILGFYISFSAGANPLYNLDSLRNDFYHTLKNASKAPEFHNNSYSFCDTSAIAIAYQGVSWALLAKNEWNPIVKLSLLKKYKKTIDVAIQMDGSSLEVHFLRYAVEYHLPGIIGMSENMQRDIELIKNKLIYYSPPSLTRDIQLFIVQFVIDSGSCTDEEIKIIQNKFRVSKY